MVNSADAVLCDAVASIERDSTSIVISGPALVVTLFTADSGDALPQRLTARMAT